MFGRLLIAERGRPDRVVELTGTATIGRTADNDIVLDSDGVSQCHAMLLAETGSIMLVDLGSTFGTFVDTVPAEPDEPVPLVDGARIRIGRAAIRYAAPKPAASAPPVGANGSYPPPLATPHLNTRLDIGPDQSIEVGQHIRLLVWVGAPLVADGRQSSRPLKWTSLEHTPVALRVRVRGTSLMWRIIPEQPTLLAAEWGTAQIARYQIVPLGAGRTKLGVRVDLAETRSLIQYFRLGVSATSSNGHRVGQPARPATGDSLRCARCGATPRAGARFCTRCGSPVA
jgi:hypothetical protein